MIPRPYVMIPDPFSDFFDKAPVSIERLQVMARWRGHKNGFVADSARIRAAKNLARMQERDGRWMALASDVSGISETDLQNNVALAGNDVLLATLIDISHRAIHSDDSVMLLAQGLPSRILNTHPRIQHDFCSLWNTLVQEATNQGSFSTPVQILRNIRQHYILLHQDTDAAPTAFSASTDDVDELLYQPSSYPFCDITNHRSHSTSPLLVPASPSVPLLTQLGDSHEASPTFGGSPFPQQVNHTSIIPGTPPPSDPTTLSKIGDSSQTPAATLPALPVNTNPSSYPTDASPVGAAFREILPATVLSHTAQRDIVAAGGTPPSTP